MTDLWLTFLLLCRVNTFSWNALPVDSSAARIPLPVATIFWAISLSSFFCSGVRKGYAWGILTLVRRRKTKDDIMRKSGRHGAKFTQRRWGEKFNKTHAAKLDISVCGSSYKRTGKCTMKGGQSIGLTTWRKWSVFVSWCFDCATAAVAAITTPAS